MASGDTLLTLTAGAWVAPATTGAGRAAVTGGSTPSEPIRVWAFDADTVEYIYARVTLPQHYDGGGLTCKVKWSAFDQTTGNVQWGLAVRDVADDAEDLDTAHTYAANEVTAAAPTVVGELSYDTITFTDGADMDSWAAGNDAILQLRRVATDATNDTMTGDAYFHSLEILET